MSTKDTNKQASAIDRSQKTVKPQQKGRNQDVPEGDIKPQQDKPVKRTRKPQQATEQDKPKRRTSKQSKPVQGNLGAVQGDIKTQECNSTVAQADISIQSDIQATDKQDLPVSGRQSAQDTPQDALQADLGHLGALKDDLSVHDMRALVKANKKVKKQVFSFRGSLDDIRRWKAYSAVTGRTMESIGVTALNEYIRKHKLTAEQQQAFDLLVKD